MPRKITRPNMYAPKQSRAMGNMNVTPFIDVLLVLLIMLIMAVPIKVHETTIDLPGEPITPPAHNIGAEHGRYHSAGSIAVERRPCNPRSIARTGRRRQRPTRRTVAAL